VNALLLLPVSNPVCVHEWVYDPVLALHRCEGCGFEITDRDLAGPIEGGAFGVKQVDSLNICG
jgi:hypothetical protein